MRLARRPSSVERYLGSNERILVDTRQHPMAIAAAFVAALGSAAPLGLVLWGLGLVHGAVGHWLRFFVLLGLLWTLGRLAWRVLGWEFAHVYITNEKLVYAHGILDRQIASTPLVKVSELTVRQPLMGRLFDYGALVIETTGTSRGEPLHGLEFLPAPAALYRLVGETARRERTREGGGSFDVRIGDDYDGDQPTRRIR